MKNLSEIKEILSEHKADIKIKYNIKEISIFGSYVKKNKKGLAMSIF